MTCCSLSYSAKYRHVQSAVTNSACMLLGSFTEVMPFEFGPKILDTEERKTQQAEEATHVKARRWEKAVISTRLLTLALL